MWIDGHQRVVDYLRVSVTERCNFRCSYCMPDKPFEWQPKESLLSFEELFEVIKLSLDNGVQKIRLTGGEPTLREHLEVLIAMIHGYHPAVDLSMTTNGFLLESLAQRYKEAGLKRVNISLDTLQHARAIKITGKDVLGSVLKGINKALEVGLAVKLNSVAIQGVNEDEIVALIEFARQKKIPIRFIEYMENSYANAKLVSLSSAQILEIVGRYTPVEHNTSSPAKYYRLDDGYEFGIIEPHNDDFCATCNRLRLTAEGDLIPCLYFDESKNLKNTIRAKDSKQTLAIIQEVLANKPEKNRWSATDNEVSSRAFYETGG